MAEGLAAVQARHHAVGAELRDGLEAMGLELFAAEGSRLPSLTTVKVPDGVNSAAVRAYLLENFSMEIGSGSGAFTSTVWRIGMMGPNANRASVKLVLGALEEAIAKA
jgi:alanine-glyoxylate transaminase/serine-glyoxylate transaminase/serine-pyruvate transaminase